MATGERVRGTQVKTGEMEKKKKKRLERWEGARSMNLLKGIQTLSKSSWMPLMGCKQRRGMARHVYLKITKAAL